MKPCSIAMREMLAELGAIVRNSSIASRSSGVNGPASGSSGPFVIVAWNDDLACGSPLTACSRAITL